MKKSNTYVGVNTGGGIALGQGNVSLGENAGREVSKGGSYNISIGTDAEPESSTLDHNLAIGNIPDNNKPLIEGRFPNAAGATVHINGTLSADTIVGGGGGGGIPEAPADGSTYGRKDRNWEAITFPSPFDPASDYTVTGEWTHQHDGAAITYSGWGSSYVGFHNRATGNRSGFFGWDSTTGVPLMTLGSENDVSLQIQSAGTTASINMVTQGGLKYNDSPILSEATHTVGTGRVPAGGTYGQVLAKSSDIDNEVRWVDPSGGGAETLWEVIDENSLAGLSSLDIPVATIAGYNSVKLELLLKGTNTENYLYANWRTIGGAQDNQYWSENQVAGAITQVRQDDARAFTNTGMFTTSGSLAAITASIYPDKLALHGTFDSSQATPMPTGGTGATWMPINRFACTNAGTSPDILRIGLAPSNTSTTPSTLSSGSKYRLIGEVLPAVASPSYVIGFGDSYSDRSNNNGTVSVGNTTVSARYDIEGVTGALMGHATSDGVYVLDYGVGGQRSDQILTRVPDVLANTYGANVALITAGTNDVTEVGGVTFVKATFKANIQAIATQLITGGVTPIFLPVASIGLGTGYDANVILANEAINEVVAATTGAEVVTFTDFVNDKSLLAADNVHLSAYGSYLAAKDAWAVVRNYITDNWNAPASLVPPFDLSVANRVALSSYGQPWQTGTGFVPAGWSDSWGHPQGGATYGAGASDSELVIQNIGATDVGGEGGRDYIYITTPVDVSSIVGTGNLSGSIDVAIEGIQGNYTTTPFDTVTVGLTNETSGYIGTSYTVEGGETSAGGVGSSQNIPKVKFKFGTIPVDAGHTVVLGINIKRTTHADLRNLKVTLSNPRVFEVVNP